MCCLFSSYRKVSRQLRMREAAGDPISLLQDVPSVFPAQQFQQQRVVTANPVCTSSSYSRVNQLQQGSNLPMSPFYCASKATPSPLAEFQQAPRQWPVNPPPSSVWRSQECSYVDQTNQQYNVDQQKQLHTLMPCNTTTQSYAPSPQLSAFYQLQSFQQIGGSQTTQQSTQGPPPPPPVSVQQPENEDIDPLG